MITEKGQISQARRNWTSRLRAWRVDRYNQRCFGPDAPRYAERIWIKAADAKLALKAGNSKQSALVTENWPQRDPVPVTELVTIKCCLDHWRENETWEQTGVIDQMLRWIEANGKVDRLSNREQVIKRYAELDALYERVVKEGRLRTRQELVKGNFREEGGMLFNIGPDGEPYFGGKGHHRLAIVLAAGLECFPAQIGVVHSNALDSLSGFRSPPQNG